MWMWAGCGLTVISSTSLAGGVSKIQGLYLSYDNHMCRFCAAYLEHAIWPSHAPSKHTASLSYCSLQLLPLRYCFLTLCHIWHGKSI
jgi:hypothetical protein